MNYSPTMLCIEQAVKRHASADHAFELHVPSLRLRAGEVCVVAGKSGCGKTTLLDALGCISPWQSCACHGFALGERMVDAAHLSSRKRAELRRCFIGYVLQQGGLMPLLTAWENIMLALRFSGRTDRQDYALALAEALGVGDELHKRPEALSIGQRQRVSIVRALAPCPALLLADEPTGALDPVTAADVRPLLLKAAREQGSSVVIVTHDVDLFTRDADVSMGFTIERRGNLTISTLREQYASAQFNTGKEVFA